MGSAQITQIPVGTSVAQAWSGVRNSTEQVMFWNQDITNTIYLGFLPQITANGNNTIPVPPNGSFLLPADRSVFVIASVAGVSSLVVIPNAGGQFRSLTQGLGSLAIPSIFSPNFVTGVSGWKISKDGSSEFNNVTVRGTFKGTAYIFNAAGHFFYSGTPAAGNLIYSNTNSSGLDQFNNAYIGGLTKYDNVSLVAGNFLAGNTQYYSFTAQPNAVFTALHASVGLQTEGTTGIQVSDFLQLQTGVIPSGLILTPVLYSTALGDFQYISGLDGATYEIGHQENASSTTLTLTTSPQVVASIPVVGANRYHVTAWTHFNGNAGLGTASFGFDGTATVSHSDWNVQEVQNGAAGPLLNNVGGGAAIPLFTTPALANGIGYGMLFDLTVTFSGSGTFNLRGQVSVANTADNKAAFLRAELAP